MNKHTLDLVERLLRCQLGIASGTQLQRCGLRPQQIYSMLEGRRLTRLATGVFGSWGMTPSTERTMIAGVLSLGDGAAVSHRGAARSLGFEEFQHAGAEFSTIRRRRNAGADLVVHSTRRLGAGDITTVPLPGCPPLEKADDELHAVGVLTALPVTSAARTIVDLCHVCDDDAVSAAIDAACRLRLVTPDYLVRFASKLRPGRPWIDRLYTSLLDAGGHSWLEREFLKLVRTHQLPRPRTQVVHRSPTSNARVDFEFSDQRLVVEVSGRRGHSSDENRRRDADRRNALQEEGLMVMEFVTIDVKHAGEAVIARVARNLASRAAVTATRQ